MKMPFLFIIKNLFDYYHGERFLAPAKWRFLILGISNRFGGIHCFIH